MKIQARIICNHKRILCPVQTSASFCLFWKTKNDTHQAPKAESTDIIGSFFNVSPVKRSSSRLALTVCSHRVFGLDPIPHSTPLRHMHHSIFGDFAAQNWCLEDETTWLPLWRDTTTIDSVTNSSTFLCHQREKIAGTGWEGERPP